MRTLGAEEVAVRQLGVGIFVKREGNLLTAFAVAVFRRGNLQADGIDKNGDGKDSFVVGHRLVDLNGEFAVIADAQHDARRDGFAWVQCRSRGERRGNPHAHAARSFFFDGRSFAGELNGAAHRHFIVFDSESKAVFRGIHLAPCNGEAGDALQYPNCEQLV